MKDIKINLRNKRNLLIISMILLLILIPFIGWRVKINSIPAEIVYFSEDFNGSLDKWSYLDSRLLSKNEENPNESYVKISSKRYMAPHLNHAIASDETPPDSLVFKFQVRVSSFTSEAITLGTLDFPNHPIALVVNQNGEIGLAYDIFNVPVYSSTLKGKLKRDEWQDIYLRIDGKKQTLTVYLNRTKISTKEYKELTYPLQQILLGTIWVKGGGNYGTALDISFDNIAIGNDGILYKPTFVEYIKDLFFTFNVNNHLK